MTATTWRPGTTASVEIAMHQGRAADDELPVTLVLDRDDAMTPAAYVFLEVASDAAWGPILTAATAALRAAGCPAGAIAWAGQPDRLTDDCGCSWIDRELALPTAGDTETHEGAQP